ncbi:hypothetical protein KKG31_02240 [Patescibacteria group bacterium]|nr:hypothetical protein [Patescibacteria group bacterium]
MQQMSGKGYYNIRLAEYIFGEYIIQSQKSIIFYLLYEIIKFDVFGIFDKGFRTSMDYRNQGKFLFME